MLKGLFGIFKKIILLVFLISLACGLFLIHEGYTMYEDALAAKSLAQRIEEIRQNPDYTALDQMPQIYLEAVVSVEDHRYYRHPGIDVIAISRALWNDLWAGALIEGGSTITQQLAKNLYFTQEKLFTRKIAEVFMAFDLEKTYNKNQILEFYLNSIYFGNGYYCVQDASVGYFGKLPAEMNAYESTLLAGIPNAPSVYALTVNPTLARQRQKRVLEKMIKHHYLTKEEAEEIFNSGATSNYL